MAHYSHHSSTFGPVWFVMAMLAFGGTKPQAIFAVGIFAILVYGCNTHAARACIPNRCGRSPSRFRAIPKPA